MSQSNPGGWHGGFVVRGNSLLLPFCANRLGQIIPGSIVMKQLEEEENSELYVPSRVKFEYEKYQRLPGYFKWIYPTVMYDIHVPHWALYADDNEIATQGPDWWRCLLFGDFKHNYNCALGYSLGYRSFYTPFGIDVAVNYEWRGLCVTEGTMAGLHRTSGVVPTVMLNYSVLGNRFERTHGWNIVLEGGVSYVKNLTYNDPLQLGKTAVNDGLRYVVAIGSNFSVNYWSIRYEWDRYNYFNVPNTSSRMNSLMLSFGHRF